MLKKRDTPRIPPHGFSTLEFFHARFLSAAYSCKTASLLAACAHIFNILVKRSQAGQDCPAAPAAVPAFAEQPTFEPTALFLTWQRDPTTTMTMQWIGTRRTRATRPIWYAKEGTKEWRNQPGGRSHSRRPTDRIIRSELTGLEPDTEYRFRVGIDSAEQRFRTMPAKATNTIHFVSGGDAGIGTHPVTDEHVAAAQARVRRDRRRPGLRERQVTAIFLEFLKNYSRDLRDDQDV